MVILFNNFVRFLRYLFICKRRLSSARVDRLKWHPTSKSNPQNSTSYFNQIIFIKEKPLQLFSNPSFHPVCPTTKGNLRVGMRYEMPAVPKGSLSETAQRYIGLQENINMIRRGFLVEILWTELGPSSKIPSRMRDVLDFFVIFA